ncbi:hypothetical protein RFI_17507 [Reticulomyxa filosa]|uniref:Uncharacterized protein n=1 Tax=Reticulomyxa filosa TaxID=46433 RepID=X6N1D6_RETFI|nr:hypothetical protein RFI_17507 [Reticulomyxa filosa]|eukprot:ETO19723.1 hypothetical protein RFI_17507 [Reticulomyxa filosa]
MYSLALQKGSSSLPYYDHRYNLGIVTLKHFDAYSLESYNGTTRYNFNAIVSPYMFSDTYWPAFRISVQHGGAKGVMCSYNSVNGVPSCCNNYLLNQVLRKTWGFQGYIVSDSGAIEDIYTSHNYTTSLGQAVQFALEATCDMESCLGTSCGGFGTDYGTSSAYQNLAPVSYMFVFFIENMKLYKCKYIYKYIYKYKYKYKCKCFYLYLYHFIFIHLFHIFYFFFCKIAIVDNALKNTLKLRFELGLFDPISNQPYWKVPGGIVGSQPIRELNEFAAKQTMSSSLLFFFCVLQTNTGPHYNASLALLGAYTGQVCHLEGSYACVPTVLDAFEARYTAVGQNVVYSEGCDVLCNSSAGFPDAFEVASKADVIVLMMGINTQQVEMEGQDRVSISLPGLQYDLAMQICLMNKPTVLVLINGGIVAIDHLKYICPAILEAWLFPLFFFFF